MIWRSKKKLLVDLANAVIAQSQLIHQLASEVASLRKKVVRRPENHGQVNRRRKRRQKGGSGVQQQNLPRSETGLSDTPELTGSAEHEQS